MCQWHRLWVTPVRRRQQKNGTADEATTGRVVGPHMGVKCLTGGMVLNCSATCTLSMGKFCCAASSWDVLGLLGPFE